MNKIVICILSLFIISIPAEEISEEAFLKEKKEICGSYKNKAGCDGEDFCLWYPGTKKCAVDKSKAKSLLDEENCKKNPKKCSKDP